MKKLLFAAALIAGGAVLLQDLSSGHGGTYRGPGDTVPAGGGGGGGGGPTSPGSGGAPGAPSGPGPTSPGPVTPGAPGGAPAGGGGGPQTGPGNTDTGPDLTIWDYWWGFNREPYINLKSHIHSADVTTGSDEFFIGQGEKTQARDTLRPSETTIRSVIVPALKEALKNEKNNHIVTGAMMALAKIGDQKDESGKAIDGFSEYIKPFLADSNQEIKETAGLALGILASDDPANLEILTALVNDKAEILRNNHKVQITERITDRSRAFAAYGLGLLGYKAKDETRKQIVDTLVKLVDGEARKMATRDLAVACISSVGLIALPVDEAAMATPLDPKKDPPKVTEIKSRFDQIVWLMGLFKDEQGLNFLVRAHVPQAVARLLSDLPADSAGAANLRNYAAAVFMEDVRKLSKAKNEVQASCAIALGQLGDADDQPLDVAIRKALMEAKEELASNVMAKHFAAIALAQCSSRPGTGANPMFAVDPKNKDNSRKYLLETFSKAKGVYRPWVALALGVLERGVTDNNKGMLISPDTATVLRGALGEAKSPPEVGAYAIAMGIMRDSGGKEVLIEKLEKVGDDGAKGFLSIGLGLINDRESIERIQAIVKKSQYRPELLKSAAIALGMLGDKELVKELIAMLENATGLAPQAAISSALGFIGDKNSVDPLIAMLKDKQKTESARGFAAVALGIVADKEDLPWNAKISVNINYFANTASLTNPAQGTGILDIL